MIGIRSNPSRDDFSVCVPAGICSEFDTSVTEAIKAVEVSIRDACPLIERKFLGIDLVRKAFAVGERPDPLTDTALPPGELEAMMDFFTGAIGTFKNVIGHRYVNLQDPQQARDTLDLASLLLTMLSCRDTVAF